tara:strand:- start:199 stop:459 length:261 start_codon:yes stop_codon:yes gene_type:complete
MMENKEMIYTAIYQNSQGNLSYETYSGHMSRADAWIDAAKKGGANDKCLVALVPGVHPVYFYSDYVNSVSEVNNNEIKNHDLFELK